MLGLKPLEVVFCICYCLMPVSGMIHNITCNDIKTIDGYKYRFNCSKDFEISVSNESDTSIAIYEKGKLHSKLDFVKEMNQNDIVMEQCLSIKVVCCVEPNSGTYVDTIFKVSGIPVSNDDPPPSEEGQGNSTSTVVLVIVVPLLIIIFIIIIIIIIIVIIIISCFFRRKEKLKKQNQTLTFCGYMGYLRTGFCSRTRSLPENGNNMVLSRLSGREVQDASAGLKEIRQNGEISDGTPRECGENDPEHDNGLESVQIHSIDSQSDGNTARPLCLESSLSNERMLPTENGDLLRGINDEGSSHPHTQRKAWDDTGESNRKDPLRDLDSKHAADDEEDQKVEEQPLLLDQGSAIPCGTMASISNPPSDTDVPKRASTAAA